MVDQSLYNLPSHHLLNGCFDDDALNYLKSNQEGKEILSWLRSSYDLVEQFKTDRQHADYSFLILPAFKALERWLLHVAPFLGVQVDVVEKVKTTGKFILFFNDESLENFYNIVLEKLQISAERKKELKSSVQTLHSYLKTLRHNPAHCGNLLENASRAQVMLNQTIGVINDFTISFIKDGLIAASQTSGSHPYPTRH